MRSKPLMAGLIACAVASAAYGADPLRPLALIEIVSNAPAAKVQAFDYLYPGAKIDLRPTGSVTIAYFDNCKVETFTGGQLKVDRKAAKISGGKSEVRDRACRTSALKLSPSRAEAGVAVKRVSPFDESAWREITVKGPRPNFIWPAGEAATVSVYFLDANPKTLVWKGSATANRLAYPGDAPALATGAPYEVVVERGGATMSMVFSIDPGLEVEDGPLASAVPLGI